MSLHWAGVREVGMHVRFQSEALFARIGMRFLSPRGAATVLAACFRGIFRDTEFVSDAQSDWGTFVKKIGKISLLRDYWTAAAEAG